MNIYEPAFPVIIYPGTVEQQSCPGLNKREWFAANAPVEIPNWFEHVAPEKNIDAYPDWQSISNEEDRQLCKDWLHDPIYDLPDYLQWFSDKVKEITKANAEYNRQNTIARYFQWRRYYAETLLSELEK